MQTMLLKLDMENTNKYTKQELYLQNPNLIHNLQLSGIQLFI